MSGWIGSRQRIIPYVAVQIDALGIVQFGIGTGITFALQSGDIMRPIVNGIVASAEVVQP